LIPKKKTNDAQLNAPLLLLPWLEEKEKFFRKRESGGRQKREKLEGGKAWFLGKARWAWIKMVNEDQETGENIMAHGPGFKEERVSAHGHLFLGRVKLGGFLRL
jgi:hypothetical protein